MVFRWKDWEREGKALDIMPRSYPNNTPPRDERKIASIIKHDNFVSFGSGIRAISSSFISSGFDGTLFIGVTVVGILFTFELVLLRDLSIVSIFQKMENVSKDFGTRFKGNILL